AVAARATNAGGNRPVGAAPGEHEQVGAVRIVDLELWNVVRDAGDLLGPQAGHQVMVLRVVGDVAGQILLLEAADPVFQARGAGDRPRAGQGLVVTHIWPEVTVSRLLGRQVGVERGD